MPQDFESQLDTGNKVRKNIADHLVFERGMAGNVQEKKVKVVGKKKKLASRREV